MERNGSINALLSRSPFLAICFISCCHCHLASSPNGTTAKGGRRERDGGMGREGCTPAHVLLCSPPHAHTHNALLQHYNNQPHPVLITTHPSIHTNTRSIEAVLSYLCPLFLHVCLYMSVHRVSSFSLALAVALLPFLFQDG